jgi:hypothetical protein
MVGEEDGKLGHGWSLKPALSNNPLIIMDPRRPGAKINLTFGSHVDVLPTILDLLGHPVPEDELYQGVSLYSAAASPSRPIYIQSYRDRALVQDGHYYWVPDYQDDMEGEEVPARAFAITNEGTRTIFTEVDPRPAMLPRHLEFERFQHSFIVHYDHYREELAGLAGAEPSPRAARTQAGRPALAAGVR